MEDVLQRKHHDKKKLNKVIKALTILLEYCLNVLIYSVLLHKINIAVRRRSNTLVKDIIRNFLINEKKNTNQV